MKNIKNHKIIKNVKLCTHFALCINILSYYKMPKKETNWNTYTLRRFDADNFGLSIDPSYTGKDVVNIEAKSQHLHTKFKIRNLNR